VKLITLPNIPGAWLGVRLEAQSVAGTTMWSVTIRGRSGSPCRRWFGDQAHALAFALDQSETRRLPFFDLRDPEAG
jgi:hypothetical protein